MTNPGGGGGRAPALALTSDIADNSAEIVGGGVTGDGSAGIAVVHVDGILDATTRQQFADYLEAISGEHGPDLILDLAGVTFMDSRALGLIVHHWQRSTSAGGHYALVGVRYQHARVLWVTGLADRLPLYDTVEDALAGFAGEGSQDGATPP